MQIDDDSPQRLRLSLEGLNARIARLAIGLSVNLDDQSAVTKLMESHPQPPITHERRGTRPDGPVSRWEPSNDRRVAHLREELRGLLVLRYHMQTVSLNDNGLTTTRQIVEQAEQHLVMQGFKPGAAGMDLNELFKAG
ncbi:hypothetical protein [Rhodoferax sp.]|uniref:hypothetical protein n=1 Tax=Rhodoferax sp. TaxID=50421 RepID=UPI00262A37FD|nr:hypothetical protein [Rhodoferax sp.]MDD2925857.1 hypothetical protein [Rhodoferax sp.]